jgi:hypothetical protein
MSPNSVAHCTLLASLERRLERLEIISNLVFATSVPLFGVPSLID